MEQIKFFGSKLENVEYFQTKIKEFIGRAERYFYSTTLKVYMVSDGFFYITELVGQPQNPSEEDHELVWIKRFDVMSYLFHEHQTWAVERAFSSF